MGTPLSVLLALTPTRKTASVNRRAVSLCSGRKSSHRIMWRHSSQREVSLLRDGFRHYRCLDLYRWPDGSRIMTKKFAFLIVAAMGLSAPVYAQSVRVITGDIEHVYGPG